MCSQAKGPLIPRISTAIEGFVRLSRDEIPQRWTTLLADV
jgi:hypothetical protein